MLLNRDHPRLRLVTWLVAMCWLIEFNASADRQRPYINPEHTTLVADNGQLLRGVFVTTENGILPARRALQTMKDYGFNAIHCYAECAANGYAAGAQAAALDQLVQWTRKDGLYLVITIGNCEAPVDADFNAAFWNFYAGRYANEKHVIYEVQNEPAKGPGLPENIIRLEKNACRIIRAKAPETPVLLFSYMAFDHGAKVVRDIEALGRDVDWSRTAVGFHGYGSGGREACRKCLQLVLAAGYPCFQTEFYNWPWGKGMRSFTSWKSWYQDVDETGDFERMGVSWLTFMGPDQVMDDTRFKNRLGEAGILWQPDYGCWPAGFRGVCGNKGEPWSIGQLRDTLRIPAPNYDHGGEGVSHHFSSQADGGARRHEVKIGSSDWVEYTTYISFPGYYEFTIRLAKDATSTNASLRVSFGGRTAVDGWNVSPLQGSRGWNSVKTNIYLSPGQQVLRLQSLSDTVRLDWIELAPVRKGVVPDGVYAIFNRDQHLVLVASAPATNGSRVFLGQDDAGERAWWQVRHLGAGEYEITCLNSSKSLDVVNHERRAGAPVRLWDYADTLNQHWVITPASDGFYNLVAAHSGLCLDVNRNSPSKLAPVAQLEFNGSGRQQWSFIPQRPN